MLAVELSGASTTCEECKMLLPPKHRIFTSASYLDPRLRTLHWEDVAHPGISNLEVPLARWIRRDKEVDCVCPDNNVYLRVPRLCDFLAPVDSLLNELLWITALLSAVYWSSKQEVDLARLATFTHTCARPRKLQLATITLLNHSQDTKYQQETLYSPLPPRPNN